MSETAIKTLKTIQKRKKKKSNKNFGEKKAQKGLSGGFDTYKLHFSDLFGDTGHDKRL